MHGLLRSSGWQEVLRIRRLLERLPELARVIARSVDAVRADETDTRNPITVDVLDDAVAHRPEGRTVHIPDMPGETRGIRRSDRIARMLPAEAMLLGHPRLRLVWHARRAERTLLSYEDDDRMEEVRLHRSGGPAPPSQCATRPATGNGADSDLRRHFGLHAGGRRRRGQGRRPGGHAHGSRPASSLSRLCVRRPGRVGRNGIGRGQRRHRCPHPVSGAGVSWRYRHLRSPGTGDRQTRGPAVAAGRPADRFRRRVRRHAGTCRPPRCRQARPGAARAGCAHRRPGDRRLLEVADNILPIRDWRRYGGSSADPPIPSHRLTTMYFPGALRNKENRQSTVSGDIAAATLLGPHRSEPTQGIAARIAADRGRAPMSFATDYLAQLEDLRGRRPDCLASGLSICRRSGRSRTTGESFARWNSRMARSASPTSCSTTPWRDSPARSTSSAFPALIRWRWRAATRSDARTVEDRRIRRRQCAHALPVRPRRLPPGRQYRFHRADEPSAGRPHRDDRTLHAADRSDPGDRCPAHRG